MIKINMKYHWPLSWLIKAKETEIKIPGAEKVLAKFRRRKIENTITADAADTARSLRG